MPIETGKKNKLLKGLTDRDVLMWEEEKMRYQRKRGQKVTDLMFLRYLLMVASRPVVSSKDGVAGGFLSGSGPVFEKGDTLLAKFRSQSRLRESISDDSEENKKLEE